MTTLTALPTVRGDLLLITGGRTGAEEDAFSAGAALLVDAAFAGAIAVSGRKLLGLDLRKLTLGPVQPADPLLAELRRRVASSESDSPWDWCRYTAGYAQAAVRRELVEAGLAAPVKRSPLRRRTLEAVDASEPRARVEAALDGTRP